MTIPTKKDEDGNDIPDWDNAVDLDEGRWNWKQDHPKTNWNFYLFTSKSVIMFTFIIALLLQLGTIANASDFNHAEYNEQTSSYDGQTIIIKDEIVY